MILHHHHTKHTITATTNTHTHKRTTERPLHASLAQEVVDFLKTCGEPNLVALTQPARLSKALDMLDTSKDGEMDMDEWMAAIKRGLAKRLDELADERERRERAAAAADEEFSAEFLNMARKVRSPRPIVLLFGVLSGGP